jgi:glycine cleavage system H protein
MDTEFEELMEVLEEEPGQPAFETTEDVQEIVAALDIPWRLRYSDYHVWIEVDGDLGTVGITDFVRQLVFLILDVHLPDVGQRVAAGDVVAEIWALVQGEDMEEITIPVPAPVSGEIIDVNGSLRDRLLRSAKPERVQEDPYGKGWLFTIWLSPTAGAEIEALMDASAYRRYVGETLSDG